MFETSSIVKRSRSQSSEKPITFSCSEMRLPERSFHAHARSMNLSRPRSKRFFCSRRASSFSSSVCTAIDAWSVPGIHIAFHDPMRRQRIKMSCSVEPSAWPMCSDPVTLGGGSVIANGTLGLAASAWK